jgi:NADH dehydrogenase
MIKIIIIGGGFAGLAAMRKFSSCGVDTEITLIERKRTSDFLPELPDVLGRGVKPAHLARDVKTIASACGADLIQAEAGQIDLYNMEVHCAGKRMRYDYLIIASGSETSFYGNGAVKKRAYKLDDAEDAARLRDALDKGRFDSIIVAGGGYTGIEAATNLKKYCDKKKFNKKIYIIERAPSILGPLPQSLKEYTVLNLLSLGIKTLLETTIVDVSEDRIKLSSGDVFDNALLVWAAGVATGEVVQGLKAEKCSQGRLKVDECLRVNDRTFAAGDAACFMHNEKPLRMAVQFAILEGHLAASNVINSIRKLPLRQYRPVDLGYIVPMANNRSCGIVFGRYVSGPLATFIHYAMCVYRLPGLRNKVGFLRDILL